MFSDKENINILTSLLMAHGVKHAVVCPGSRNMPIVHNLNACSDITCHPVTDERSAGFYALGMAQATGTMVVVCVTSGTALLNLAPAVAEAHYRHTPLVVISADRPAAWIEQLDGQTLQQPHALGGLVGKCVSLPEPHDDETRWHCNRLVNEALLATRMNGRQPVHINVPIGEPLFTFNTPELPQERVITWHHPAMDINATAMIVANRLASAKRPMVVVGQRACPDESFDHNLLLLKKQVTVLHEPLSSAVAIPFEEFLAQRVDDPDYMPDFVLYMGGHLVSKRLKQFLRQSGAEVWAVSDDGEVHDTLQHLTRIIEADCLQLVDRLADYCSTKEFPLEESQRFARCWISGMNHFMMTTGNQLLPYSYAAAVSIFEQSLSEKGMVCHVHYANSMAVRMACRYARRYVWCNRGVNGIEGSISTAAGFSLVTPEPVFVVTGDLSFFYDQNALWNQELKGNLRILLINNGGGGIFHSLKGMQQSEAFSKLVIGRHHVSAQGICMQNDITYLSACNACELAAGINMLITAKSHRPLLLEVFTGVEG